MHMSNTRLKTGTKIQPKPTKGFKPNKFSSIFSNGKILGNQKVKTSQSYSRMDITPKHQRPLSNKNALQSNKQYFSSKEQLRKPYLQQTPKTHSRLSEYASNKRQQMKNAQQRPKSKSPRRPTNQQEIVRQEKFTISSREIRHYRNIHPNLPKMIQPLTNHQPAKHSIKSNGIIKCYAACTNQGPIRNYNEDRVAIILNINKPEHCIQWKKAAFFGVFDGHGGVECADYLRDNLHSFLIKEKSFPSNIPEAIINSFAKCQSTFLEHSKNSLNADRSGSCAIVILIYGDHCYAVNVGDSRAIMSSQSGQTISQLSIDHKPSDQYQQKRILQNGGRIYQTKLVNANPNLNINYEGEDVPFVLGPHRVLPGRLSVTRTFGDIEAKQPQFGGNPKAVISTPEIRSFRITPDNDFILLGCDGIFDKLSNEQVIQAVWDSTRQKHKYKSVHEFCGLAVQNIMKLAVYNKTQDNITVVMIGLENLQTSLYPTKSDIKFSLEKFDTPKIVKSTNHLLNSSTIIKIKQQKEKLEVLFSKKKKSKILILTLNLNLVKWVRNILQQQVQSPQNLNYAL